MPSGRTHDSITLWSLPLIAAGTFERTQNASLTLILSGGYLFSGLMFGPDLDIHSQQYKRWGILRWIWLPYRRSMRHRSVLSHGFLIGTLIRILYLLSWIVGSLGMLLLMSAIAYAITGEFVTWTQACQHYGGIGRDFVGRSLQSHYSGWLALLLGLELGALSHSLSDWIGSRYKRLVPRKPTKAPTKTSAKTSAKTSNSQILPTAPPSSVPPSVELPPLPQDSQLPPRHL